ncbi:uncharacterized protein C1orf105 homolog [Tursiops truncatus]|uniref:uncharacterized protein C1orf105 homolog n=1 Tax=Tursiops truncatus TaxID=9739 RepID=UPI003CCF1B1A
MSQKYQVHPGIQPGDLTATTGTGGSEAPKRATPARRAGEGAGVGQGRASPRAPYSPSRASPARRRPSPGLGPAGDGGGGPDTLTPTRNPPARECEGVRGSGRAAARLLPHPGRRGRVGGRAFPGLPQPPRLERPSSAFAAAAAPSWPLRGTSGFYPGKNAVSVPRFDKIPWFSEASLINKPLVLSLPKRYPHSSATFLVSSKKAMNLPILFQVPDVLSKAGRNRRDPTLIRNKQLCSTCQEMKMVQPRTMIIPDDLKLSFSNYPQHRMMSLHPPKAQTVPRRPRDDIPTEGARYRLPILGPRTAVSRGLLSDAYDTLQDMQLSSLPRKEPVGKTMKQ